MKKLFVSMAVLCLGFTQTTLADEVRVGVSVHDAKVFDDLIVTGRHGKEQSLSVIGDYIFETPGWLEWAWQARPFVGGSLNLGGKTSFVDAGLLWRKSLSDNIYGEVAFGLAVHDGAVRTPDPLLATTPAEVLERQRRKNTEIEFGSRVLFRTGFTIGYELNEKWAGEFVFEHLSHGQILGGPENEGSNELGVRVARRF